MLVDKWSHAHTHAFGDKHTHTHKHIYTHTHTYTHAHTHTHTHALPKHKPLYEDGNVDWKWFEVCVFSLRMYF